MNRLAPGVRRIAVGGVLFALLFFAWILIFRPLLIGSAAAIERLQDARFELNRARAVVNERSKLSENMITAEEQSIRPSLQAGDAASTAIGYLQSNVTQLARDSGLKLESMSTEPLLVKEPLTKLMVVLKATGSETALAKMLAALESQPALMVIDRLTVVGQDLGQTAAGKASIGVAVEMRIGGYWAHPQQVAKPKS